MSVHALIESGFLARIAPGVARSLVEGARAVVYPPKSVTFVGDDGIQAGIAMYGLQRVYLLAPDGRQLTIRYVRRGELLGALRIPSTHVTIATQAVEEAAVLHLVPAHLARVVNEHPQVALAIVDEYAERLGHGYRALLTRAFENVGVRVARDLVLRLEALGTGDATTPIKVTDQELADSVGSVREVVTRSVGNLCRRGVIERTRAGIRVVALGQLQKAGTV